MFGNLGFPEILIIMVIVLLLFGAKRIPEIAGSMGKGIREFKKQMSDVQGSLQEPPSQSQQLRGGDSVPAAPRRMTEEEETRPEPKRLM